MLNSMLNLEEAVSPHDKYCNGFGSPGNSGKGYFTGLSLSVGACELKFNHDGSTLLDGINAFDRAEAADVYIGQINMITVSSFCGLDGVIWGYDTVRAKNLFTPHPSIPNGIISHNNVSLHVYSANPLIDAARGLFGTVEKKKFPLLPGAHVPCANKSIEKVGPAHIYAGIALGIAKDRNKDANLFMEDIGEIPQKISKTKKELQYKNMILNNLAKSIIEIGKNQKTEYKEIFVEIKDIIVEKGQVGCALIAAPYFTLARNAIPSGGIESLKKLSLEKWNSMVK